MPKRVRPRRVLAKGIALFLILEFAFDALPPDLQWLNVYHAALKRSRFPISTVSPADDALDVDNLDAMFASHIVSEPKAPDAYRVLVLGDSAVWGIGLTPQQTLPGQMDALGLTCGNKDVRVYNLSFPEPSASKDLMILDTALSYQPDEIVWLITWGTLKPSSRLDHPLIAQNPAEFYKLARRFDFLPGNYKSPDWITQLTDRNRTLFRVLRYQLYSLINIATGLDQIPGPKEVLPVRLSGDLTFEGMHPPKLDPGSVSIDQIQDFYQLAHDTPVWLINEPMLVLSGIPNSDVRYNVFYPRWIYDQYRQYVHAAAAQNHWNYLDLWNMFPPGYYTDTPFHLNPDGEAKLAKVIAAALVKGCP